MFFAYISKFNHFRWGLKFSFFLIFLFLALRYNYGNDYTSYLSGFIKINSYNKVDYFDKYYVVEPGWILLNRIFRPFGFFAMIAVLALFNCVIYYLLIKKYVPVKYYWIAIFLYVFTPGFMLTHISAMRQSVSIALFLFSLDFLYRRAPIRYFAIIIVASFIHTSAMILLPVYLLTYAKWRINKVTIAVIVALFLLIFIFGKVISPVLYQFVRDFFERYEPYLEVGALNTGFGAVYFSSLLLLTLYYEQFQDKETALIFKVAIIGFLFIPLSLLIELIGRVGMYFTPATIIVYPIIFMKMKSKITKTFFLSFLFTMVLILFFAFFESEVWREGYASYQTVFSSPRYY